MKPEELAERLGLRRPTEEQAAVAQYPPTVCVEGEKRGAPLLVVAGAGSGKTETLSLRAIHMINEFDIEPRAILGLTFTRKAAGELADRLGERVRSLEDGFGAPHRKLSPNLFDAPVASTYNAFALGVVQEFGALAGINAQSGHMDEAAAWQLMNEVVSGWTAELGDQYGQATVVDKALALRDDIANQGLSMGAVRTGIRRLLTRIDARGSASKKGLPKFFVGGREALCERLRFLDIIERFEAAKEQSGKMDYADQVVAALRIVERVPEVAQTLRARHQVVFLDEFQDTSVAQLRLFAGLFRNHPVTAVGDPNQAIYGWRGASAASLLEFHELFNTSPGVPKATLNLSTAWRNDRSILSAATVLAKPLSKAPSYVRRVSGSGAPQTVALPQLEAREGAPVGSSRVLFAHTAEEAMSQIVAFVRSARDADDGKRRSVAVLSRTNAPLRSVVEALREADIPAQLVGGDALLGHPAVRDLRAALSITADPGDTPSLLRLLTNLDLGAADLDALSKKARQIARVSSAPTEDHPPTLLLEAVVDCAAGDHIPGLSEVGAGRVKRLGEVLESLRSSSSMTVLNQVINARQRMHLDDEGVADPTSAGVTSVLDEFTDVAAQYEEAAEDATMGAFLGWLDAAEQKQQGLRVPSVDVDPEAVQVMTIHASKGLEWDAVVVADVAAGRFPAQARGFKETKGTFSAPPSPGPASGWWQNPAVLPYPLRADAAHLPEPEIWDPDMTARSAEDLFKEDMGAYRQDEERRLAYVAVTRARHAVFLVGSWFGDGGKPRFPSIFAAELFSAATGRSAAAEFLDGKMHRFVADEDHSRTNPDVPLTDGKLTPLPPKEDWADLVSKDATALFPRDPGPVRRRSEQVAARIQEDSAALGVEPEVEAILASLDNQDFAADLRVLLSREAGAAAPPDGDPEAVLAAAGHQRALSVTEIASFQANPEEVALNLVRPVPSSPGSSALLGTELHRWLEQHLRRLASSSADPDVAGEQPDDALPDEETQRLLEEMKKAVYKLKWLDEYRIAGIEVPFSVAKDGIVVRGRIDAVFKDAAGDYLLVDWKTSSRPKNSMRQEEVARYSTQLDYYRAAWEEKAHAEGARVETRLVYIYPGGTWTVTEDDLAAQKPKVTPT